MRALSTLPSSTGWNCVAKTAAEFDSIVYSRTWRMRKPSSRIYACENSRVIAALSWTRLPCYRKKTFGHVLLEHHSLRSTRRRRGALQVTAAFFGVGAPEAVLVGVVALVLFGPKGLAQAAKSLGATLRAFAPTIRELTEVSNELKSTLEEEIGLNDIRQEFSTSVVKNPVRTAYDDVVPEISKPKSSQTLEDISSEVENKENLEASTNDEDSAEDLERMRQESAKLAWGAGTTPQSQVNVPAGSLRDLSIEELEAELKRRQSENA